MPSIPGMALCLILPNRSSWGELIPDPVRNHVTESAIKVPSCVSKAYTASQVVISEGSRRRLEGAALDWLLRELLRFMVSNKFCK